MFCYAFFKSDNSMDVYETDRDTYENVISPLWEELWRVALKWDELAKTHYKGNHPIRKRSRCILSKLSNVEEWVGEELAVIRAELKSSV